MREVELLDVAEIIAGQSPKSEFYNETGDGVPFFQGKTDFGENYPTVTTWCTKPKKMAKEGDILFSVRAPVGPTNIAKVDCCIGRGLSAIRPKEEIDRSYLRFYFKKVEEKISDQGRGSTFKAITQKDLKALKIPLPSLSEQKTIVAKLDRAQRLIDIDKEMLAKYDDLIQSVFLEMFGDPVRNPKGWEVYPIKNLAESSKYSIKAGPFGSALKKEFYVNDGYKIYGQEQVIRDDFDYGDYFIDEKRFEKLKNCEIKKDDVLISLVGSYGYISVVPDGIKRGIINPRLMKISFNEEMILPFFFKSLFTNKSFEKLVEEQTHGGTMGILNTTIVKKLSIPVPPVSLQKLFLKKLGLIKREKTQSEKSFKKSEELFSSLVQGAFG